MKENAGTQAKAMEVARVQLPNEGANIVQFPKGGKVLGVIVHGYVPTLAVHAERDAPKETRSYYVTRQLFDDVTEIGAHVGTVQEPERAAMHVFEIAESKKVKKD